MIVAPPCPDCKMLARRTTGAEVYPHRTHLHDKVVWKCDGCGAYVGSHPDGSPLGTPAGPALRRARIALHNEMLDPLWKLADRSACYRPESDKARKLIQRTARVRVYEFLADRLGLTKDECHVSLFDIETCRRAWRVLKGLTYADIRDWARERRAVQGREAA